jgi:hypothetical protein
VKQLRSKEIAPILQISTKELLKPRKIPQLQQILPLHPIFPFRAVFPPLYHKEVMLLAAKVQKVLS